MTQHRKITTKQALIALRNLMLVVYDNGIDRTLLPVVAAESLLGMPSENVEKVFQRVTRALQDPSAKKHAAQALRELADEIENGTK